MECRDERLVDRKPNTDSAVVLPTVSKELTPSSHGGTAVSATAGVESNSLHSAASHGAVSHGAASHGTDLLRTDSAHARSSPTLHLQTHGQHVPQSVRVERTEPPEAGWDSQDKTLFIAGQQLIRSHACYKQLYESLPFGFCELSCDGEILHCNRIFLDMIAASVDRVNYTPFLQWIHANDQSRFSDWLDRSLVGRASKTGEFSLQASDGRVVAVQLSATVSDADAKERIVQLTINAHCGERAVKSQEASLQSVSRSVQPQPLCHSVALDRHFKLIAANLPGPVSRVNRDLRYEWVNGHYEKITGRTCAEVVGMHMRDVLGEELFSKIAPRAADALAGSQSTFQSSCRLHNDELRYSMTTFIPDVDDAGEVKGFFVVGIDITATKLVEKALATTGELLELTGQLAKVGGWELDLRSNELFWTRETCRIHEVDTFTAPSLDEALQFFSEESQTKLRSAVSRAIDTGEPWDMELPFTTAKGNSLWVRTQGLVVYENNRPIKLQGVFQDVTERKQAEAASALLESQLRQSQKMEAIGTLAGGVAHDFNNILAVIFGNAELALNSVTSPVMTLYCLREIEKASNRARDLVRQIMSFGRPQATDKKATNLVEVVDESIRLLRATLPARVSLTVEGRSDAPAILADATQIQQVIINLVTNAYQAFGGGSGSIEIQVDCVAPSDELTMRFPQLGSIVRGCSQDSRGKLVRLSVTDDGPGIDPAIRERLFEPFFTTKAVGEGTGLGLSVVHGIVRSHEGAITVESEPGHGARFVVYFPIYNSGDAAVPAHSGKLTAQCSESDRTIYRVLYVDDDQAVMQSICNLLSVRSFEVHGFTDQLAAVESIRDTSTGYDLVLTDYNMPTLSGLEFARFVRAARPELPIILISGLIDEEVQSAALLAGIHELLPKPFSLNVFCEAVDRIMKQKSLAR